LRSGRLASAPPLDAALRLKSIARCHSSSGSSRGWRRSRISVTCARRGEPLGICLSRARGDFWKECRGQQSLMRGSARIRSSRLPSASGLPLCNSPEDPPAGLSDKQSPERLGLDERTSPRSAAFAERDCYPWTNGSGDRLQAQAALEWAALTRQASPTQAGMTLSFFERINRRRLHSAGDRAPGRGRGVAPARAAREAGRWRPSRSRWQIAQDLAALRAPAIVYPSHYRGRSSVIARQRSY